MYNIRKEVLNTTTVIYADSLLLVNFSMDFLSLYITARLMNTKVRAKRLCVSALAGALFALAAVLLEEYSPSVGARIAIAVGWGGCAFFMVKNAVGGKFRMTALFCAVNVGLGGSMTAIYSLLGRVTKSLQLDMTEQAPTASPVLFFIIALISGAVSLLYGHFRQRSGRQAEIKLCAFGRQTTLTLLVDSGNLLRDPISGKSVIVVSAKRLSDMLPKALSAAVCSPTFLAELSGDVPKNIRLIPTRSAMGQGMMIGFLADSVESGGRALDAVIAIDTKSDSYGGYDGIISDILL